MRARRAFSLLEVIVALGVLAIGATAAFGLLVAAAAAGRRAEHHVNSALLAESEMNQIHLDPTIPLDAYPLVRDAEAVPGEDAPPGAGLPAQEDGYRSRYLVRDGTWRRYPGYRYDIILTPQPGADPNQPWEYLVECVVRWSSKGRRRSAHFSTVRIMSLVHVPPQ